jgi:hypothetical protein
MFSSQDFKFARNVLLKAGLLFLAVNVLFALTQPLPVLGGVTLYNGLFPGRPRLPYSDVPDKAYSLSLFNLNAMFAAHVVAASKPANEFRVIFIGDSSVWGFRLENENTLTANLNRAALQMPDGRTVRAYNLGYPIMSLMKDLLILDQAMNYQPDLIVWPLTLESFPYDKQLSPPLLQNNPELTQSLITNNQLSLNVNDPGFVQLSFWDKTLVGQRRALADLVRFQFYGGLWAATGVDQNIPAEFTERANDLEADVSFHNLQPPTLRAEDLAFEILQAGVARAGAVPILFINEPMFVADGQNSNVRYNFFYPRWAYDQFRPTLAEQAAQNGWHYVDLWDAVPNTEFTDSAVHLTPAGSALLAEKIGQVILEIITR